MRVLEYSIVTVTIWILLAGSVFADVAGTHNATGVQTYFLNLDYGTYSELLDKNDYLSLQTQPQAPNQINQDVYQTRAKSTKKAFIYSLILPGAGEFYADSKLKAAAFIGMEALFWAGYFHFDGKGDDKKVEYRSYADMNWDATVYRDSMMSEYFEEGFEYVYNGDTVNFTNYQSDSTRYDNMRSDENVVFNMEDSLGTVTRDPGEFGFTHHSVNINDNEYYENIGKYDQFSWGWGGYQGNPITMLRDIYLGMRKDANGYYDKAKWSVVASLANRVLSAFDAAITVKKYNRKQDRFSADIKFKMLSNEEGLEPRAVLTVKFR